MNKLNLILDLSNLFYRSLYSANGFGSFCSYNDQDEINNFIRKLSIDICYVLRLFNPKTVIFALDDTSWRKELLKDIHDSSLGYKGQRVKNENMNWDNIFNSMNEFIKILSNNGFIVSKIKSAEADDLCSLWKDFIFEKNENCIIVSSDADIRQLVDYKNNNFCIVFNPIGAGKGGVKKIYCNNEFNDWINKKDEVDIFFSNFDPLKSFLTNLLKNDKKISYEIIDPNNIVLTKIFCGDDGDNIPSFYEYYDNKAKKQRITPAKCKRILESLSINNTYDLDNKIPLLKNTIESVIKKDIDDIDVSKRLARQKKLVELKSNLFPTNIINEFLYSSNTFNNYKYVNVSNYKINNLLNNTKYLDNSYNKPKEASIFKELDRLINKNIEGGLF